MRATSVRIFPVPVSRSVTSCPRSIRARPIPAPLRNGAPGEGYPWPWTVHAWLPGEPADRDRLRRRLWQGPLFLPETGEFIGTGRLRDWLRLLDFEMEPIRYGGYVPSVQSPRWLRRWGWMDRAGARWWPILGSIYAQVAIKRVHGMRLIEPVWRERKHAARALVVPGSGSVSSRDPIDLQHP